MLIPLEGGCLCEAVRYSLRSKPLDAGFCHCRICQQSTGAPSVAWLTLPRESFSYVQGQPSIYLSSSEFQREFCGQCGTQLVFRRRDGAKVLDVTIASLDKPDAIKPQYHIWTQSQISWCDFSDELPRYADAGPDIY